MTSSCLPPGEKLYSIIEQLRKKRESLSEVSKRELLSQIYYSVFNVPLFNKIRDKILNYLILKYRWNRIVRLKYFKHTRFIRSLLGGKYYSMIFCLLLGAIKEKERIGRVVINKKYFYDVYLPGLFLSLTQEDVSSLFKYLKDKYILRLIADILKKLRNAKVSNYIYLDGIEFTDLPDIDVVTYKNGLLNIRYGVPKLYKRIINYIKNKVVLDIGAYIGDSSIILADLTGAKVYAFEPDSKIMGN